MNFSKNLKIMYSFDFDPLLNSNIQLVKDSSKDFSLEASPSNAGMFLFTISSP